MNKIKLFASIFGVVLFMSALFSLLKPSWSFLIIMHIFLFVIGLILSILTVEKITKSSNSLKSKIYFSIIVPLAIFFLIVFCWFLGNSSITGNDPMGYGILTFFMLIPLASFLVIVSSITGISLSIKRKLKRDFDFNLKPILTITTIIIVVPLLLFAVDMIIFRVAISTNNVELCKFSIPLPYNTSISGMMKPKWKCYYRIAANSKDVNVCLRGNQLGARKMGECVRWIAYLTYDPQLCEYLSGGNGYIKGLDCESHSCDRNSCASHIKESSFYKKHIAE